MRIALLTHQFPGIRLGGIGVYTLHCARALADAGHEPHLFTFTLPADVRASVPAGIHLHEVADLAERVAAGAIPPPLAAAVHAGGEPIYRFALASLLCDAVRAAHAATPFDIIEGPEYEALALPLLLLPLGGEVRIITHLHSGSAILHQRSPKASPDSLLFEAMECAAILAADARCAPSRQALADTAAVCPVPNADVLPLPFYPDADSLRLAGKKLTQTPTILYIGRLELIKGAHLLVDAANAFLPRHPDAHLHIAGPDTASAPDQSPSMAAYIRNHLDPAIAPRVHFLGEQTRPQLTDQLHRAAFLLVPSLAESYSYVCCEALAAGCPIIVSDQIGATDVVADAGLSFERGNSTALAAAMERLWTDLPLRQKLSTQAVLRATTVLSAQHTLHQRIAFYEKIRTTPRITTDPLAALPARYIPPLLRALAQVTTFLAGLPNDAHPTPGTRLLRLMNAASQITGHPTSVILYGAGRHTSRLLSESHLWQPLGHRILSLIDDHPRFQKEPTCLGLPVESLANFQQRWPLDEPPLIVLSTDTFQQQFWDQTAPLRARGITVQKLYD
jgi:glycosyltransferase involved in cell wall biosynthesis